MKAIIIYPKDELQLRIVTQVCLICEISRETLDINDCDSLKKKIAQLEEVLALIQLEAVKEIKRLKETIADKELEISKERIKNI